MSDTTMKLPQGWEIKRLDEVCEFRNGLWNGKKPPYQNVGVIRNTNFTKDGKLDDSDIVYLDVEQLQFAKRKLQYGDIILEKSGGGPNQPVGRVIIFDKKIGDFSFSNFTSAIRIVYPTILDFNYLHRFLFFSYVTGATETMQSQSTGIRNLKFDEYKAIEIPFPPLPEQQRIVAILDEAFTAIDTAKANAEQNLKNAKELFESYLQGVFENKGEGWEEKPLREVCSDFLQGINTATDKTVFVGEGIPILQAKEIGLNKLDMSNSKFISEDKFEEAQERYKPKQGDILYNNIGSSMGRSILVDWDFPFAIAWNVMRIIPNKKITTSKFLNYILQSPSVYRNILFRAKGVGMPFISKKDLVEIVVAFPPVKNQQIIVQNLDALSAETKKIEAMYQQKINDLNELKKSILEKAFRGEL